LKSQITKLINEKHLISNGSNGYYIVDLKNLLNCSLLELNDILNELYIEKFIIVRKAINGKLIMKK
jgi:hypothetical protein